MFIYGGGDIIKIEINYKNLGFKNIIAGGSIITYQSEQELEQLLLKGDERVFIKGRTNKNNILFIDASNKFKKGKSKMY